MTKMKKRLVISLVFLLLLLFALPSCTPDSDPLPMGERVSSVTLLSSTGGEDTYKITFSDNTTLTFSVRLRTDGKFDVAGEGILSVEKTKTEGDTATCKITFTDNSTATFTVKNKTSDNPDDGKDKPRVGENGNWWVGTTDTGIRASTGADDDTSAFARYQSAYGYDGTEQAWITAFLAGEFDAKTVKVTFVYGNGRQNGEETVSFARKVPAPTDPAKKGYLFSGWYLGDTAWDFSGSPVTAEMTLAAKWTPVTYRITYEGLEGASHENPATYTVESDTITLTAPAARTGYLFKQWRYAGAAITEIDPASAKDMTITAVWELDGYRIHYIFDDDHARNPASNPVAFLQADTDITLADLVPSDKYLFLGWYSDSAMTNQITSVSCREAKEITVYGKVEKNPSFTVKATELIFQMTKNSGGGLLSSGCKRYLAGEDFSASESIDAMIAERNASAEAAGKVSVTYTYCPDTKDYLCGKNAENIFTAVMSRDPKAPDMYCNFVTDLVAASLRGSFANLMSKSNGKNHFSFLADDYNAEENALGYMNDYAASLTLSGSKMYVLASDYFTDLVRSFTVMPFNVRLLGKVVAEVDGDYNKDGVCNVDDFYAMIRAGKWNYEKLADYAGKIYQQSEGNTGAAVLGDELVGLAVADYATQAGSFLYSSSVTVIQSEWDSVGGEYDHYYPESNSDFPRFAASLGTLFASRGVVLADGKQSKDFAESPVTAIRERFVTGHVLFGGTVAVGALEQDAYRKMQTGAYASAADLENGNYGYGVAPMPLYRSASDPDYGKDTYRTLIGKTGKAGAISATTTKFSLCTAFLDYQSTHSTGVLDEYYGYCLAYDVIDGSAGDIDMLRLIRSSLSASRDSVFDDVISMFNRESCPTWTELLATADFRMANAAEKYAEIYPNKRQMLNALADEYRHLPA